MGSDLISGDHLAAIDAQHVNRLVLHYAMSSDGCLLSRPDIGVVSENDHRVGKCLCEFCTCGKHVCVASRRKRKGSFATSYQHSFYRKTPVAVHRPEPQRYSPDHRKMDFETSHQREYKNFTVHQHSESQVRSATPTVKFTSHSSYSAEFPNWGEVERLVEKRPQLPVRLDQVRFTGQSMYHRTYVEQHSALVTQASIPGRRSSALPLGTWSDSKSTTSQSSYRPFGREHMSKIAKRPKEEYVKVEASPLHFRSISQVAYQPRTHDFKDPRLVRCAALKNKA